MRIILYVGAEGECIIIERPTDIFALLDWCQTKMIDLNENAVDEAEKKEFDDAANYLSKLMDKVEQDGFGSIDDVDNTKYH